MGPAQGKALTGFMVVPQVFCLLLHIFIQLSIQSLIFDQRLYGWFSLFVAINTIPAGILCLTSGYGGNAWYGIIWFLWGILWLTAFIEINLKKDLGKFVPYLAIFEGIITAWIPGLLMLWGKW